VPYLLCCISISVDRSDVACTLNRTIAKHLCYCMSVVSPRPSIIATQTCNVNQRACISERVCYLELWSDSDTILHYQTTGSPGIGTLHQSTDQYINHTSISGALRCNDQHMHTTAVRWRGNEASAISQPLGRLRNSRYMVSTTRCTHMPWH
jgi:hypothetical protein